MEHLMAQRAALQVKKADFERRIKDLGSLPGDAFDKYRDAQPAELHKQLTRCNSQLKKYRYEVHHGMWMCLCRFDMHLQGGCGLPPHRLHSPCMRLVGMTGHIPTCRCRCSASRRGRLSTIAMQQTIR